MPIDAATEDFFRLRLDHMIDLRHSLAVLSSRMPWQQIEASVAHLFSGKVRAGKKLSGIDLFGEQVQMSVVKSNAGRPSSTHQAKVPRLQWEQPKAMCQHCLCQKQGNSKEVWRCLGRNIERKPARICRCLQCPPARLRELACLGHQSARSW